MNFDKVLGVCDPKLVQESGERLSATFTELAMGYTGRGLGSRMGGDVFLHQMVSPLKQICDARAIEFEVESNKILQATHAPSGVLLTDEDKEFLIAQVRARLGKRLLHTAATNGREFFWNPQFIVERTKIGLRLVVGHEGFHTIYMHPTRRGSRLPGQWNVAVDFKVNFTLIDDLRLRNFHRPEEVFRKELGDFVNLTEYAAFLRDPFNPPAKLAGWNPIHSMKRMLDPGYSNKSEGKALYYAEPNLSDDLKKPENIYDFLSAQIPKCSVCGKPGVWKKPKEYQDLAKQLKEKNQGKSKAHEHQT
jgi:hypothetical protein